MRATTLARWLYSQLHLFLVSFSKIFYENVLSINFPYLRFILLLIFCSIICLHPHCQIDVIFDMADDNGCLPMLFHDEDCEDQDRPVNSIGYFSNPHSNESVTKGETVTICGTVPSVLSTGKTIIVIEAIYGQPDVNGVTSIPSRIFGQFQPTSVVSKTELYRKKVFNSSDHVWKAHVTVPCDFDLIGIRLSYLKKGFLQRDLNKNYKCFSSHDWIAVPEIKVIDAPTHQVVTTCESGLQEFIIENGANDFADTLFIIPPNPFFLNSNYNLGNPYPNNAFDGILKIPKDPSDGDFHFFHDLQTSEQFLISYGQNNFSELYSCDEGIRISKFALLTLLKVEIPELQIPDLIETPLLDCSVTNDLACHHLLGVSMPELREYVDLAIETLDTTIIKGIVFDETEMDTDVEYSWHDTDGLANPGQVCYDDLEGGKNGCKTYTNYVDILFFLRFTKNSLGGPHGVGFDPSQPNFNAKGKCSFPLREQTFCQMEMPPPARFELRCDANEPICFPCKPGWDGIRVFEAFLDTDPRQVPPRRSGLHVGDLGWYYNCGVDVPDPNTHDDAGMRQGRLNMEERFCVSDSLLNEIGADPRLLWVDYVRYNNNGNVVDSSFQKSPLGVFTMPSGLQQTPMTVELEKPINESDSCNIPFAIPILDSVFIDQDSIENLINGMVDDFNLSIDFDYGPEPPFEVELEDFSFGLTGPTHNYQGNRTICYTNLPPEPGSCQEYNLSFTYKLRYTNPNVCHPGGGDTKVDSCRTELVTVDVCKRVYPPRPDVFIVCDRSDTLSNQGVCLSEPIESYSRYKWELINGDPTLQRIYYTNGNCMDSLIFDAITNTSFQNGNQQKFLNFMVSSVAPNGRESVPAPVSIIAFPLDPPLVNSQHGIQKPITVGANQYDSLDTYCSNPNPENGTYWDLSIDSSAANQSFEYTVDLLNQTNFVQVSNISEVDWTPQLYELYQGAFRVCYGHLPDGDPENGDDKSVVYTGTYTPKASICFGTNVLGNLLSNNEMVYLNLYGIDTITGEICDTIQGCPVDLMSQKVYKIQTISNPNICPTDPNEIVNGFSGTNPNDCDEVHAFSACEVDTTTIGYSGLIAGSIDSVRWVVPFADLTSSLSSLTTQNPNWYYPMNPNYPPGSTLLYKCIIYYRNALNQPETLIHCEFIHLCGNCTSLMTIHEDVEMVQGRLSDGKDITSSSSIISPNPFSKKFNFQSTEIEASEINYSIYSLDGKLVNKGVSKRKESDFSIDCSNCIDGVYLLIIDSPNEQVNLTFRIDSINK